ncbi:UNVERIFIED_CONTAM: DNA-binding LacI/PurR family transcriptional regulator [Acetivibrio alkalicellulosi]
MKNRKTIGLMINGLDGSYLTHFWLMIKKAVEKLDCNLIVYQGKALNSNSVITDKHSIVYGFVDNCRIDGLIITSPLSNHISSDDFQKLIQRYEGIPLVSIGKVVPGATSILVDNKKGMKNQIQHLVKDHGYKKIAFVTGPKSNYEAKERYEAYIEVLEENNIPIDNKIIFEGDFYSQTGYKIMKEIISNNIEYDAIVFSNDDMALGSLKAIGDLSKIHNFDISRKKVMCGFDDSIMSKLTKPSLTTVSQPFEELCEGAVKILLEKIEGKKTDDLVTFPAVFVKRQSCGCKVEGDLDDLSNRYLRLIPNVGIHTEVQTYSLNSLYDKITDVLKMCNLKSCFISIYFEGTIQYNDSLLFKKSFNVPKRSELLYAYYNDERIEIKNSDKHFNTKDIVPECYLPTERRFIYLVNPLFFDKDNFGFLCIEMSNDDVIEIEALRGEISNTLKGALIMLERDNMEKILLESERLSSLGQLVGGISHNLMSPIMSISGVQFALENLINEYRKAVGDPEVSEEDHIEISDEMELWNNRLKEYNSYMSKVISTVKSQTIHLNSNVTNDFTVEELLQRIEFIKNNNIKVNLCNLNIETTISTKTKILGDISSLVQILENLIVNCIDSYNKNDENSYIVDMKIYSDGNSVIFSVKDYGDGMSSEIKEKIFKHMVTSKGKNGTGLSLLLSYSTIKGRFRGEMWFEENENRGIAFYISLPVIKSR